MISLEYIVIISAFLIYYLTVIIKEKKVIKEPQEIISKFLSVILLYAGVSLIYLALTGKPMLGATLESYNIYIFIIGFIAILWTIPELLEEFEFFKNFGKKKKNSRKK
jgi:DNA integrity scanning protein DisA with diadenylate cyclase activity